MSQAQPMTRSQWLNKVPEVTLFFWIIKMMSTTVGETAADFLNMDLHFGLTGTSIVTGGLLLVALARQLTTDRYIPWLYWSNVLLVSVFGTLVTDNLTDHFDVPLAVSTLLFSGLLAATFLLWFIVERSLSINAITSRRREIFYWAAILFTFALGTAAGDWVSEGLQLGYATATAVFAALIIIVATAHYVFKLDAVVAFWIAYILTRPLGASVGDLLSQSTGDGGLGLGAAMINEVFLATILLLVGYLTLMQKRRPASMLAE